MIFPVFSSAPDAAKASRAPGMTINPATTLRREIMVPPVK
jgi:hypothetical protein